MILRPESKNNDPHPAYDASESYVTLAIHHGGTFVHDPDAKYVGGRISYFDYCNSNILSLNILDKLCEEIGYEGQKKYYRIDRKKFRLVLYQTEIFSICSNVSPSNMVVVLYLDASNECLGTDIGSSNPPLVETNNDEHDLEEFEDSDYDMEDPLLDDEGNENENQREGKGLADGEELCGDSSSGESIRHGTLDSEDNFESDLGYGEEGRENPIAFNPKDVFNPKLELGMIFSNKNEFKQVVQSHAVMTRRNIKITKNDKRRIYARCLESDCDWKVSALKVGNECTFQIREFVSGHKCGTTFHVKNVKSSWLSHKYEDCFRTDPDRSVKGFRNDVIQDIRVSVSKHQAYRAKRRALKRIEGDANEQFEKLWDYALELRRTNPGSSVIMVMTGEEAEGRKFDKFYVCFQALKHGFLSGCRPIIGVDGCHLKGPHGGILLTAISIDPNNNLFPIAYAVVSAETRESWEWFLNLLKEDLEIVREDAYTFISDRQKGLVQAFDSVFPGSENRFCVRHLHANFKLAGFRGLAFKNCMWKAARASTVKDFEVKMKEMGELDRKAAEWFDDKPACHWSRSHFSFFSKCDMLLNNVCESFNSTILQAREKPILTMLEWIREYLMTRLQENRDRAGRRWSGKLCPRIRKIVEKHMDKAADCIPIKADDFHYEISCFDGRRFIVDLSKHSCSCRKWELSGIPCNHAMSAILNQHHDPEDYVNECYWVTTFQNVYAPVLKPINGADLWGNSGFIPPLPPSFGRGAGRPKKARRHEVGEPVKKRRKGEKSLTKLGKQPFTMTCSVCGERGHNKKGCGARHAAIERVDEDNEPTVESLNQPNEQAAERVDQSHEPSVARVNQPIDLPPESESNAPAIGTSKITARKRVISEERIRKRAASDQGPNTTFQPPRSVLKVKGASTISAAAAGKEKPSSTPIHVRMPSTKLLECPPFADDHQVCTQLSQTEPESSSAFPVILKDGKKYVTLSHIEKAVAATLKNSRPPKDQGKKK